MIERQELPPGVCPECYRTNGEHAPDCAYAKKLDEVAKQDESIPKIDIENGKTTLESQLREIMAGSHETIVDQSELDTCSAEVKMSLADIKILLEECRGLFEEMRYYKIKGGQDQRNDLARHYLSYSQSLKDFPQKYPQDGERAQLLFNNVHDLSVRLKRIRENII